MTPRTSSGPKPPTLPALERAARDRLAQLDWSELPEVRRQVVEALGPVLHGADAARQLTVLLRSHPGWDAHHRALASEALFGVALWRRRLAYHAGSESPAALLAALLRDLAHLPKDHVRHWTGTELPDPRPPPDDWPTRFSWPDSLVPELERALGPEAPLFAAASNLHAPITVRANRLHLDRDALAERLRSEGRRATPPGTPPTRSTSKADPTSSASAPTRRASSRSRTRGASSSVPSSRRRPGQRLLDLCAGAGGKTLLLAAGLQGQGQVDAYDTDGEALERLRHRAERAGASATVRVLHAAPGRGLRRRPRRRPVLGTGVTPARARRPLAARRRLLRPVASAPASAPRDRRHARQARGHGWCTPRAPSAPRRTRRSSAGSSRRIRSSARWRRPSAPELRHGPALVTLPHRHGTDGFYGAVLERGTTGPR